VAGNTVIPLLNTGHNGVL